MSVEKLIVTHESSRYTILSNKVLQGLRNAEALGLWCYLSSLPPNWEFYKEKLREHFNIGRDKIDNLLAILRSHNLLTMHMVKNAHGHFSHCNLHVKNGEDFIEFPIITRGLSPVPEIPVVEVAQPLTENQSLENSSYKNNINKYNNNIIKNSCANEKKKSTHLKSSEVDLDEGFDEFWELQVHKKGRKPCLKLWRSKKLHTLKDKINDHVKTLKATEWQRNELKFICLPLTYLNQERWNDEIITNEMIKGQANGLLPKQSNHSATVDRLLQQSIEARIASAGNGVS